MTTLKDLTNEEISIIKARILRGDKYQEIASDYRLNQGRIAHLKYGRKYPHIAPAEIPEKEHKLKDLQVSNDTSLSQSSIKKS